MLSCSKNVQAAFVEKNYNKFENEVISPIISQDYCSRLLLRIGHVFFC